MGILVSLFFGLIFVVLLVLLFVLGFIRSLFTFGRRSKQTNSDAYSSATKQAQNRSKVFGSDEGEYAEYEEIK